MNKRVNASGSEEYKVAKNEGFSKDAQVIYIDVESKMEKYKFLSNDP